VSLTDLPPAIRTSNPGSFAQATGYFPAPLAALHTLKAVVNPDVRGGGVVASQWTIRPLCLGEFPEFEKSSFTYLRNAGEKIRAPILGWLLQSGAETILVDTGQSSPEAANHWHSRTQRSAHQAPKAALWAAGVNPASLRLVILTHLHWDHCYNLEIFPEARFLVQAEELRAAVDPIPTQRFPYEVGIPGLNPSWLVAFNRLEVIRGDVDVAPGVRTLLLPGHTPGLQGVLVDTAAGRHLIASDAVPLYANLGTEESGPIPPGIHTDVAACLRSFDRMRAAADMILPSHEMEVLKHSVYPIQE
jgi:glyoxylase-like metal-dependent hydrolase (beta-lactamase superfamily II)